MTQRIVLALVAYFTFNAAVGAMPKPAKTTGFYFWLFGFAQTLCANVDRVAEAKFGNLIPKA
jgi:hypothetical protein